MSIEKTTSKTGQSIDNTLVCEVEERGVRVNKNTFLTFCLFLLGFSSLNLNAGLPRLSFKSPEFSQFSAVTTQIKPIPFDSMDVCKVEHQQMVFTIESLQGASWEEALKKEIAKVEKLDERYLSYFHDFSSSFRSEQEILDNVYCFTFLPAQQLRTHPDRLNLVDAYEKLSQSVYQNLALLIYFRDGFENSAESRLWVYFYHKKTGDVYKVKASQSLESLGIL